MTFFVLFSLFVISLLVFCVTGFKNQDYHKTLLSYRIERTSFAVMVFGFVGSLLTSILQSAYGG